MTEYEQAIISEHLCQSFKRFYFQNEWHEYLGKDKNYHELKGMESNIIKYLDNDQFIKLLIQVVER